MPAQLTGAGVAAFCFVGPVARTGVAGTAVAAGAAVMSGVGGGCEASTSGTGWSTGFDGLGPPGFS
jgi:hypothetical protein